MPALLGIMLINILVLKSFRFCPYYSRYCNLFCNASHKFNGDVLGYFATSCFYMPTIALNNSVSYAVLNKYSFDVQKTFTPIRVWGTVGFIIDVDY
jgi:NHS family xanthosine MFS transporter